MTPLAKFLQAAASLAKQGVKRDQILEFAKLQFGKVTDEITKAVDNIFEKSPLQKILDKRKAVKQSVDERKVLDMEGNVIDPNQPIIGGKQTKMETPKGFQLNVEKFVQDFPVSKEEAVRISKLPAEEQEKIIKTYLDEDFSRQITLMDFDITKRKPNSKGGRVQMAKGGLPNILGF